MSSILLWLPLILNLLAWVLFFLFLQHFNDKRLLPDHKRHEEQMLHQDRQTSLLQRIAAASEKHK